MTMLAGCYTLEPARMGATPMLGTAVALDLNDVGRAALGQLIGPEIGQIEGRLVQKDTSGYLLAVTGVHLLRGGDQVWRGENVKVRPEHVTMVYERHFSTTRTAGLVALGVGAAVAVGASLDAFGQGADNPGRVDSTGSTTRIPIPLRLPSP
jgi:hypothetical protein